MTDLFNQRIRRLGIAVSREYVTHDGEVPVLNLKSAACCAVGATDCAPNEVLVLGGSPRPGPRRNARPATLPIFESIRYLLTNLVNQVRCIHLGIWVKFF